jgi:fermentation-respiration switch protein FrsA (DUF1100 family)
MATLKWYLTFALVFYGGFVALLYVTQRSLQYFPESYRTAPAAAGLPEAEEVVVDTADGERVLLWHLPPRGDKPVILYLHGNGGALRHRVDRFRALTADGTGLIALSYRGYSGSTGRPTEAGLLEDAAAAYAFAAARYPPERIALWGESLGSGVAVALAAEKPVGRVVLEAGFSSAADIGAGVYWYVPVRLLMKDQFRSDQRIKRVTAPVLILHGELDDVIPVAYGERLFTMVPGEKRMIRYPGGYHGDSDRHGGAGAALKFLSEAPAAP